MPSNYINENKKLLGEVAAAFGDLLGQVVFLGGATTCLLVDEGAIAAVRQTDDVDVIADLLTTVDYYQFASLLRAHGFKEDQTYGAPICRWKVQWNGITYTVDVMPCEASILGFSNRWYPDAIKSPDKHTLENGLSIRVITPIYFLATKFEAFHGRSEGDYYSRDIEDIVFLMEHRSRLMIEFADAPQKLRAYLQSEVTNLLDSEFDNILPGLLDNPRALPNVRRNLQMIARNLGS